MVFWTRVMMITSVLKVYAPPKGLSMGFFKFISKPKSVKAHRTHKSAVSHVAHVFELGTEILELLWIERDWIAFLVGTLAGDLYRSTNPLRVKVFTKLCVVPLDTLKLGLKIPTDEGQSDRQEQRDLKRIRGLHQYHSTEIR